MAGGRVATERFKSMLTAGLVGALLICSIVLQSPIDGYRSSLGLESDRLKSTTSTTMRFLGGLRSATAAFLWLKVDRLHDEYYAEDFSKEQELVPLYRIITWLDPHFTDAYYVGSYLLYRFEKHDESWSFAEEGLRNNPSSSKMELNLGQLALFERKDPKRAAAHLEKAVAMAQTDEEKLLALQSLEAAYRKSNLAEKANSVEREISVMERRR